MAETADQGLISVRVSVIQDLPPEKRPVEFSVVRWILDPNVEWSDESSEESSEKSSSASSKRREFVDGGKPMIASIYAPEHDKTFAHVPLSLAQAFTPG